VNVLWRRCLRASARLARREEGQVVVLVAVAMVTMIGITGLSVASDWTSSASEQNLQAAAGASGTQTASSGTSSLPWAAQTISLEPVSSDSVTVDRPPSPTSSDFLLVTVTAQALGTNSICAPAATSGATWTPAESQTDSGTGAAAVSQATFYAFPQDANSADT